MCVLVQETDAAAGRLVCQARGKVGKLNCCKYMYKLLFFLSLLVLYKLLFFLSLLVLIALLFPCFPQYQFSNIFIIYIFFFVHPIGSNRNIKKFYVQLC